VREDAQVLRLLLELLQQEQAALPAARTHRGLERVQPLARLVGIGIRIHAAPP
jgi:hypothetical protein